MKSTTAVFGVLAGGEQVRIWTISNGEMSFSACEYGCIITSIMLPRKGGSFDDVTPGFSTLDGYVHRNTPYFGGLIGRVANRIGRGRFSLDGVSYALDTNNGAHTLHSGFRGYHQMLWNGEGITTEEGIGVCFRRTSPDGEQGFPGVLQLEVSYILTSTHEIIMRYRAVAGAPTPVNLTNHVYFNLGGHASPTIADHVVTIHSTQYLEVDEDLIPTGRILPVKDSVFDFLQPRRVGTYFGAKELTRMRGGYDTAYCFPETKTLSCAGLPVAAVLEDPHTGRSVTCATNQPCLQFYTGGSLELNGGKDGASYHQYGAVCLETQRYIDAPNQPGFPSAIVTPDKNYEALTFYGFMW
ncbi:MAG: galactose mutarotase [Spirochaetaceae bacterium]|jgi:aldose 1-epimerase|nr:galactose mutarotase [Spirochaetaceae bacterium]